jgi:hypothetical protein
MMSRAKLIAFLIIAASLGVGTTLIYGQFRVHPPTIGNAATRSSQPTTGWANQRRVEKQGEEQTIKSDCETLRKMGVADKDCPPAKGSK